MNGTTARYRNCSPHTEKLAVEKLSATVQNMPQPTLADDMERVAQAARDYDRADIAALSASVSARVAPSDAFLPASTGFRMCGKALKSAEFVSSHGGPCGESTLRGVRDLMRSACWRAASMPLPKTSRHGAPCCFSTRCQAAIEQLRQLRAHLSCHCRRPHHSSGTRLCSPTRSGDLRSAYLTRMRATSPRSASSRAFVCAWRAILRPRTHAAG